MTFEEVVAEVKRLPLEQQIDLYGLLTEWIGPPADDSLGLTPAQAADLDMRIQEYRSGRAKLIPGDEAFARLKERYK